MIDPAIEALLKKIPPAGIEWPIDARARWLTATAAVFDLVYGPVEKIEIGQFLPEPPKSEPKARFVEAPPPCNCGAWATKSDVHLAGCPLWTKPPNEKKPANALFVRPEGIPSNFEMCRLALIEAGRPLSGVELREVVKVRWWPNAPKDWSSCPYGFIGSGKLLKIGDKFSLPDEKPAEPAKPADIVKPAAAEPATPRAPAPIEHKPVQMSAVKQGPPARGTGVGFKHGERTVTLHQREATIASALRTSMGKGHVSGQHLAGLIGIKGEAEATIRDFAAIMNPKLADVGLNIEFYKGFGFIMKDVT